MRTCVVSGIVIVLVFFGWSPVTIAEQPPAPRGEIRIVDKRPENRYTIEENRIERLARLTDDGTLVPNLARSWHRVDDRTLDIQLRQGVTFHNGEVFDAEIVKRNIELLLELRRYFEKPGLVKVWWFPPVEGSN